MKTLKSFVTITSSLLLCLSVSATAFATPKNVGFDDVTAKKELAAKYANKFRPLSRSELDKRTDNVQHLLNELAVDVATGDKTIDEANHTLEAVDVYALKVPSDDGGLLSPFSVGSTDVTMNSVWITYDAQTRRWNASGGGYWNGTAWFTDNPGGWWGTKGETKNVGGLDSVGITYYNSSGYGTTSVVSSLGYVTDHNGWSVDLNNPSHGDGKNGVAFDFQDQMKLKSISGITPKASDFTYLGEGFAATITYDSGFSNYHGKARSMYAHTWSNTSINSIGFSGGAGNFGVTVSWANEGHSWLVFNNSDTSF
ncbi:hypothetical protein PASE110613_17660 [Paenibacillus sediminis]|uniref:Uncharacterized protein n=1 Tax=Paenibacillus sediminis TaxID=664909 RepID=A0ABS4H282_9BACL|nr:hypothetical protein [Paenibacillus sediminis]MBP1936576.1 hypothetical protein [Paenibacillus sediminis]